MPDVRITFPDPALVVSFTDTELVQFFNSGTATLMASRVRDRLGREKDIVIGLQAVPPT